MSFEVDIKAFAQKCGKNANFVVRKTVLDIGRSLVEKTPVGNPDLWANPDNKPEGYAGGHARANWSHSVGSVNQQEFDGIDPTGSVSNARIAASIPGDAAGKVHYIQNSVPYIIPLEEGHSHQAPNGMVALTQVEFQGMIQRALSELK
jgi:hypothetical protein